MTEGKDVGKIPDDFYCDVLALFRSFSGQLARGVTNIDQAIGTGRVSAVLAHQAFARYNRMHVDRCLDEIAQILNLDRESMIPQVEGWQFMLEQWNESAKAITRAEEWLKENGLNGSA